MLCLWWYIIPLTCGRNDDTMKKWLIALLAAVTLVLCASAALADEAADITDACKFTLCSSTRKATLMTDKLYTSY